MDSSGLQQALHQLVAARLVVEDAPGQFAFRHALTRDAAYSTLLHNTRRRYHRLTGEVLEALNAGRLETVASELAYHCFHADQAEKERRYARLAGELAAGRYAHAEAVHYLSRALELADEAGAQFDILLAREKVYEVQGQRDRQADDLDELEALAAGLNETRQAEVALRRASYADHMGDYRASIAAAERAVALAQTAGADRLEAMGHHAWGVALWRQADYGSALEQLGQALELARRGEYPEVEAEAARVQGAVYDSQGEFDQASASLERSLQLYRQIGNLRGEGRSLNSLGVVAYHQTDYAAARNYHRQSLEIRRTIGDKYGEGVTLLNLGIAARSQEDVLAARAFFEQSLVLCRELGDREGEASALGGLGSAALYLGQAEAARAYFEQTVGIGRAIGDPINECSGLGGLSMAANHLGEAEAVLRYALEDLAIAQEVGAPSYEASAWRQAGEGWLGLGEPAKAIDAYQRANAIYLELGLPQAALHVRAGLARAALAVNAPAEALAQVDEVLRTPRVENQEDTDTPALVDLTCYQVLRQAHDPRAREVLERAHADLLARAGRIDDEGLRRSYLENVPWHRELRAAWEEAR